jgi:caa(3)-type oxidase subunit IV
MSNGTHLEQEHAHISNSVYLIVGGFLIVLTAMEITVAYIHALRPVMVPILVILAIAKFALIAMFFMHLRYEKWALNTMFVFPLTIALGVFLSLMGLFLFLSHHMVGPGSGIHYF